MPLPRPALLLCLLLLPATASAFPFGGTVGNEEGGQCLGPGGKRSDKALEKWAPLLGGEDTRKAWKHLVDAQEPGCDAVLKHMEAGGAGLEAADYADIGHAFAASGVTRFVDAAKGLLLRGEARISKGVLAGLEPQLPQLSEEEARAVAFHEDPEVRAAALPVLIGYYVVGQMTTVMGVPTFKEIEFRGATVAPPAWHVSGVEHIAAEGDTETRRSAAKFAARLLFEGKARQEAWAPFLASFLEGSGEDQDAANLAARALAAYEVEAIDEVVARVLATGNDATLDYLLKGFERRLESGKASQATLEHIQPIVDAAGKQSKRAEKLIKKYGKKL